MVQSGPSGSDREDRQQRHATDTEQDGTALLETAASRL